MNFSIDRDPAPGGDITLSWTGQASNIHYISVFNPDYFSDDPSFWSTWEDVQSVTGDSDWIDNDSPYGTEQRYYRIEYNGSYSDTVLGKIDIDIAEGTGTLISLPLIPPGDDYSLENVFGEQFTCSADPSLADWAAGFYAGAWRKSIYHCGRPIQWIGTLGSGLDLEHGYWIHAQSAFTMTLVGQVPYYEQPLEIDILDGASTLIGSVYPMLIPLPDTGLEDILTAGDAISGDWLAGFYAGIWKKAIWFNGDIWIGTLSADGGFRPGHGYWIKATGDNMWLYEKPYSTP